MLLVAVINNEINLKGVTLNDVGEKLLSTRERYICVQKVESQKLKGYPGVKIV
jgi:hypothetical protein